MQGKSLAFSLLAAMAVLALCAAPLASQEQCLQDAWDYLKASKYEPAIKAANSCIETFARAATRKEEALQKQHALPPAEPPTEADKRRIFSQGIVNDVAAAYFVKGEAASKMAQNGSKSAAEKAVFTRMATEAYEAASTYKHAWAWDPKGWFWSPSEAASDRLANLKQSGGPGHRQ